MILRINGMSGTEWTLVEDGADKPVHGQTGLSIHAAMNAQVKAQCVFVCDERLPEAVTVGDDGYLYEAGKLLSGQDIQAVVLRPGGRDDVGRVAGFFILASVDAS